MPGIALIINMILIDNGNQRKGFEEEETAITIHIYRGHWIHYVTVNVGPWMTLNLDFKVTF